MNTEGTITDTEVNGSPLHGYRGEADFLSPLPRPLGVTLAVSRQVGARGGTIARRVAALLGWQVYTQELLEYMAGDEIARNQLESELPAGTSAWIDDRLGYLRRTGVVRPEAEAEMGDLPWLILMLAARGKAVIVGRGAGFLLPDETTLHVRVVAPEADRVGYMVQWLRLTRDEARAHVRDRERRRAEFLELAFGEAVSDMTSYDMVLNSALLGEDLCVELVADAARAKEREGSPDQSRSTENLGE